jgi:hypothetical protein
MKTMSEETEAVLAEMKAQYPINTSEEGNMVHLDVKGTNNDFRLTVSKDENILFTETWHIHFGGHYPLTLKSLLDGLFAGKIQVIVKYRGNKPVGQKVKVIQDDGPNYVSWSRALVSPFWRPKSYKTFTYETANNAVNPTPN